MLDVLLPVNQSINLYSPMQLQANNKQKKKCGRLSKQVIVQQSWPP